MGCLWAHPHRLSLYPSHQQRRHLSATLWGPHQGGHWACTHEEDATTPDISTTSVTKPRTLQIEPRPATYVESTPSKQLVANSTAILSQA